MSDVPFAIHRLECNTSATSALDHQRANRGLPLRNTLQVCKTVSSGYVASFTVELATPSLLRAKLNTVAGGTRGKSAWFEIDWRYYRFRGLSRAIDFHGLQISFADRFLKRWQRWIVSEKTALLSKPCNWTNVFPRTEWIANWAKFVETNRWMVSRFEKFAKSGKLANLISRKRVLSLVSDSTL